MSKTEPGTIIGYVACEFCDEPVALKTTTKGRLAVTCNGPDERGCSQIFTRGPVADAALTKRIKWQNHPNGNGAPAARQPAPAPQPKRRAPAKVTATPGSAPTAEKAPATSASKSTRKSFLARILDNPI